MPADLVLSDMREVSCPILTFISLFLLLLYLIHHLLSHGIKRRSVFRVTIKNCAKLLKWHVWLCFKLFLFHLACLFLMLRVQSTLFLDCKKMNKLQTYLRTKSTWTSFPGLVSLWRQNTFCEQSLSLHSLEALRLWCLCSLLLFELLQGTPLRQTSLFYHFARFHPVTMINLAYFSLYRYFWFYSRMLSHQSSFSKFFQHLMPAEKLKQTYPQTNSSSPLNYLLKTRFFSNFFWHLTFLSYWFLAGAGKLSRSSDLSSSDASATKLLKHQRHFASSKKRDFLQLQTSVIRVGCAISWFLFSVLAPKNL